MTDKEWIENFPEDWYEASESEQFEDTLRYEIIWNEEGTYFRVNENIKYRPSYQSFIGNYRNYY